MKKYASKIIMVLVIAASAAAFFAFDLHQYLTLDHIKSRQLAFAGYYAEHTGMTILIYMAVYILVTALSLPGATVMSLAGGALFGLGVGLVVISFASTIGATVAFLVSRFLLRDWVQGKFGEKLKTINAGMEKDGPFYLFTLRLVPLFPFFVINLAMGLTPIRTRIFYLVSQVGMLPGTVVYVNAGTQLAKIDSAGGILSPGLIFSFALLGIFPLVAKKMVAAVKARKAMAAWPRPKRFDYNLVVIGAGSAGLVSAYIAAAVRSKVALIEKHKMGGDCLNTGCVPSKALIRSGKILGQVRRAKDFGVDSGKIDVDFARVMERVGSVVEKIAPHDSAARYTDLGVEVIQGEGRITSPYTVAVDGKELTTRSIIVATGARPFIPPIAGLDNVDVLTSDNVWELRTLPRRLVVLGGGPIGCELAQAFARFGSRVTQVEMMPRLLIREDADVSAAVRKKFESEGICVATGHRAREVVEENSGQVLVCEHEGEEVRFPFDKILVAVGRTANVRGFGLEELGVAIRNNGTIETDGLLRTNFPTIFCVGDATGPYQFTHAAAHQAWYASVNALFGRFKTFAADYRVIPWATFTDPEVARVGLNRQEALEQGIDHEVTEYGIDDLDRAIADGDAQGLVRVLTKPGSDKILGVTILGTHAAEMISEFVIAMRHNLGLNKILGTIHIYPTWSEANKYAAGQWKRAHAPEKILTWMERYHRWMRG